MIIMSFVEMMVGTAQNIIKLFVAAALYRKLLKVHLIFGHYNTAAWDGITLALCPSVCVVVIWFFDFFFRYNTITPGKRRWLCLTDFFSISSMMLTISLTSKADISIYIQDWLYFVFSKYSSQLFLVDVSCCWLSVFFHTLDFKEPLSPSTRWCFFNDLLYNTIVTRLSQ